MKISIKEIIKVIDAHRDEPEFDKAFTELIMLGMKLNSIEGLKVIEE